MFRRIQMWRGNNKRMHIGSAFGGIMCENGMDAPERRCATARFYFTEKGWEQVGLEIIKYAKTDKTIKRIAVEEICVSDAVRRAILFKDDLQVMLDGEAFAENIGNTIENAPTYIRYDLGIICALEQCMAA